VNTFAGVQARGNSVPLNGLNGLAEHTAFKIKEGTLIKYGQIFGQEHPRKVVLTQDALLTYKFQCNHTRNCAPIGSPTNALTLDREIKVITNSEFCFTTTGFEDGEQISFKMCAEDEKEAESWKAAINDAAHAAISRRASAATPTTLSAKDLVELPFANGVSLAIMSIGIPTNVNVYSVDFDCATDDGQCKEATGLAKMKKSARKLTYTTAEKGGAIVRFEFGGKAFCFAACHLEAKHREKRWLQAKLMSDALATLDCDTQIWMGDFNTRPTLPDGSHKCCPWTEVELYTRQNAAHKLRDLTLRHDDMFLMPGLTADSTVYKEMDITFPPTFHKRLKRTGMNQCSKFPKEQEEANLADLIFTESLARDTLIGNDTSDVVDALVAANRYALLQEKCSAGKPNMCYGGLETAGNCERGGCFNTHDKDHCPGYTDRIVYVPGEYEDKGGAILLPCDYVAIPTEASADHSPVVATFNIDKLAPIYGPRQEHEVRF